MATQNSNPQNTTSVANGAPLVEAVVKAIKRSQSQNPLSRTLVVTPSLFSVFFLKRAVTAKLCEQNGIGLFNVEFMRIEEVSDRLFDAIPDSSDKPAMSRLIASELIHSAMLGLKTAGPLHEHVQNDSTLTAVQRTLQELELLDIGAEKALLQLSNGARSGLYPQLIEIQRKYARDASTYLTREQKAALAAETATNDLAAAAELGQSLIVVRSPAVPDAYTRLWETLQRLPSSTTLNILTELGNNIDHTNRNTRFYSTMGAADEPRALIRNIMSDARDGMKFGEMAVFYPTSDYASRIRDALDAAGIKSCGPSAKTLAETPAGRFVALFLAMVTEDMRRDTFTSWTSSSPVIDPSTGTRVPAVPWEVASRNAKISRFGGETDWTRSLGRYAYRMKRRAERAKDTSDDGETAIDPDSLLEAARSASQLGDFVTDLTRRIQVDDLTTWSEWVGWLDEIISRYLTPRDKPEDLERNGLDHIQVELNQVRELDDVAKTNVDFPRFTRTIQRLLRANVGGSSGWGSSILVAPLAAGTGSAFKSVHIVGMAEGGLPGPGRSDPLLSDNFRRQLDPQGSRLLTKNDHLELDQQTFQLALSCAPVDRMYWNKALLGATNESYPSPWFVNEVQKAFQKTNVPVKSLMDPQSEYVETVTAQSDLKTSDAEAASEYEFGLRDVAIRAETTSSRSHLLSDPSFAQAAAGYQVTSSRNSGLFGDFDGYVADTYINALPIWHTSATALESYAKCPYSYFLAQELNVDERIDPEESLTLSALDKGILVHSILEQFLKDFGVDDSDEGLEALREVARAEFDSFQRQEFIGYDAIFDLEKHQILRNLEEWHRTHLDVLYGYEGKLKTEKAFGYEGSELGQLHLDDGFSVQLRGKIDLIASTPDGDSALVLDFKTGGSGKYSNVEKDVTDSGTKLQLPIYSMVASEILGQTPDIQAAFWFVFGSGRTRLRPTSKVMMMDALDRFKPVINTIVDGIRSGAFPAHPGKNSSYNDNSSWENCRYCPYTQVCTSDRLIAWDRNKTSPILEDYVALTE